MSRNRIIFDAHVTESMRRDAEGFAQDGLECGGHLFGVRLPNGEDSGACIVLYATATGPAAQCAPASLVPDADFSSFALQALRQLHPKVDWQTLGEWHLHPFDMPTLSHTDRQALRQAATSCPHYTAALLSCGPGGLSLHAWEARCQDTRVVIEPREIIEEPGLAAALGHETPPADLQEEHLSYLHEQLAWHARPVDRMERVTMLGTQVLLAYRPQGSCWLAMGTSEAGLLRLQRRSGDGVWETAGEFTKEQATKKILTDWNIFGAEPLTRDLSKLNEQLSSGAWTVRAAQSVLEDGAAPASHQVVVRPGEHWLSVSGRRTLTSQEIPTNQDFRIEHTPSRSVLRVCNHLLAIAPWDPAGASGRLAGIQRAAALKGKRLAVCGTGSVGMRVALQALGHGVEVLCLERETFEISNAFPRYPVPMAPEELVGRRKLDIMLELAQNMGWQDRLQIEHLDLKLDAHRVATCLERFAPDEIAVTTDTQDSRLEINWLARQMGIPQIHAGFSDGAASVEIAFYEASSGPCAACRAMVKSSQEPRPSSGRSERYGDEQHAVPALHANIELGSAIVSRIVLETLSAESVAQGAGVYLRGGNLMWIGLEPDAWIFEHPLQVLPGILECDPQCPVCSADEAAVSAPFRVIRDP